MPRYVMCSTPSIHCTGRTHETTAGLGKWQKYHRDSPDAYKCYRNYLVRVLKYTEHPNREFAPPNGGPRLVLTKKMRFGGHMRAGKRGETVRGKRTAPKERMGGLVF